VTLARPTLRIATYNVHSCRGLDRRTRPERIAAVLRDINADIVALQEVIGPGAHTGGHAEELGALLGMGWVMAPARQVRGHQFGNAVLSRLPILSHTAHELRWRHTQTRCVQRVDFEVAGRPFHVYNVHLGTSILERRHQSRRVAKIVVDDGVKGAKIVLGDFNEWLRGIATRALSASLKSLDLSHYVGRKATFPGLLPVLHLDHIYFDGAVEFTSVSVVRNRFSAMASDHLPVVANIVL
jgi:endonuclease/exonuclease/phosphatase family metal-dependent hydrolase